MSTSTRFESDPTLSILVHKLTTDGGGGGGKFDESKVKRDKGGRFSTREARELAAELAEFEKNFKKTMIDKWGEKVVNTTSEEEFRKLFPADEVEEKLEELEKDVRAYTAGYNRIVDRAKKSTKHGDLEGNELYHYGVPGMKWGVRRRRTSTGYAPISEDAMNARVAASKPAHALSNQEMQALIARMNLERQYNQLINTAPPPNVATKVSRFVSGLLADIGKQEVSRLAKGVVAIKVEDALKAKGKTDLAKRIAPKKK